MHMSTSLVRSLRTNNYRHTSPPRVYYPVRSGAVFPALGRLGTRYSFGLQCSPSIGTQSSPPSHHWRGSFVLTFFFIPSCVVIGRQACFTAHTQSYSACATSLFEIRQAAAKPLCLKLAHEHLRSLDPCDRIRARTCYISSLITNNCWFHPLYSALAVYSDDVKDICPHIPYGISLTAEFSIRTPRPPVKSGRATQQTGGCAAMMPEYALVCEPAFRLNGYRA
ncbi:hypothetical protein GGR58DRAFT_142595 [Xylaria digitata]|nr:hypothetical protein GGR58DRAFT_142595 [Xylaria digitata]